MMLHKSLTLAMIAIQDELIQPKKTAVNPHFKNKYAPLDEIVIPNNPILKKHGLVISSTIVEKESGYVLVVSLTHESSESIQASWPLASGKSQAMAGDITYGRRYLISCLLNLVAEDDMDGNTTETPKASYQAPVQVSKPPLTNYAPQAQSPSKAALEALDLGWTVSFGKYKDKALKDIGLGPCMNYAEYLRRDAREKQKTIMGGAQDFLEKVDAWVAYDTDEKAKQLGMVRASVREEYRAKTGEDPMFDQLEKDLTPRTSELTAPKNLWDTDMPSF